MAWATWCCNSALGMESRSIRIWERCSARPLHHRQQRRPQRSSLQRPCMRALSVAHRVLMESPRESHLASMDRRTHVHKQLASIIKALATAHIFSTRRTFRSGAVLAVQDTRGGARETPGRCTLSSMWTRCTMRNLNVAESYRVHQPKSTSRSRVSL